MTTDAPSDPVRPGSPAPGPSVAALPTRSVSEVTAAIEARYPIAWAEDWDRVGLVVGDPNAAVTRVLLAVDCVLETVDEAIAFGAEMMVVHHPLLLRGVHSVATTSYKGAMVHRLIRAGIALYVAHTNADVGSPGVSDALVARLGLAEVRPLIAEGRHAGRVGTVDRPLPLAEFVTEVALRLPATAVGVRAAGDPDRIVGTVAVVGGAGDSFLADAVAAGVDAFLTADLRHHVASEHLASGGPALLDAPHWATERPWLDALAIELNQDLGLTAVASDIVTDVWTVHAPTQIYSERAPAPKTAEPQSAAALTSLKEPRP